MAPCKHIEQLCGSPWLHSEKKDLRKVFEAVVDIYRHWEKQCIGKGEKVLKKTCRARMSEMSSIYRHHLALTDERVDFSDTFTQWTYMFVFMMRHVHLVYHTMYLTIRDRLLCIDPMGKPPSVCMIGGGPGTDILGIAVFLRQQGCVGSVTGKAYVLDKCVDWTWSWAALRRYLPDNCLLGIPSVGYREFDYRENHLSSENKQIIGNAKFVTMIKSLSPVAAWLKKIPKQYNGKRRSGKKKKKRTIREWHSVYSILKHMKPGSFLLYIDNKTGPQREILMEAAKCFNFKTVIDRVLRKLHMPNDIYSDNASQLINLMGYKPCSIAGTNEVILLMKTS